MSDQLKSGPPEALQRLLPPCSGCLSDFLTCESLQPLGCGHFYCPVCLLKTKGSSAYHCFYDKRQCRCEELMPEIKPAEVLAELESAALPILVLDDLKPYLGRVDLRKVPCKALSEGGVCRWAANCLFSHYPDHLSLIQSFNQTKDQNCWECSRCLLTISLRLLVCPACEAPQTTARLLASTPMKGSTSPRVDNTFQTEEDRPPGSPIASPLRFRLESGAEGDLLEQRSACCELQ